MSKPAASRGWVCAFCVVPILAVVALALLAFSPASRSGAAGKASDASRPGTVTAAARGRIQASVAALPLAFEKNQGQTDAQVEYLARGNGYTLFLTANDAVFSLHSRSASAPSSVRRGAALHSNSQQRTKKSEKDSTAVIRMQLVGANSLAQVAASGLLPGKSNYFIGNEPSQWRSGVPHYARVSYQDVYPGVNLAYHGAERQTEFDFVVAAGANPAPIGFHFTGAQGLKTDDAGNLVIASAAGDVVLHKPVAYQEQNGARQTVDAQFALNASNVSFKLGTYDHNRELVIDPSVSYEYSTYLGGAGADEGEAIAFDSSGNAYVTGQTASASFPGTTGALPGAASVFVTEIAANGTSLIYSTYVGGSGTDSGNGIALDSSNNAFVAGGTTSANFPTTSGAFQKAIGSGAGENAFVLEISSSGTLTYCSYLGGSADDVAFGIALDKTTGVYAVAGEATSANFPTANALQGSLGGPADGFVTVWSSSNVPVYSTYLGGSSGDAANAVALDSSDNAYVTGLTESTDFPLHAALHGTYGGGTSDAFVTVINAAGTAYVYSTYLGGSDADIGDGIAVDGAGDAYVTGSTGSDTDFPLKSPLQPAYGGGTSDAFVTKLNPTGSALLYSTFLGGSAQDVGASIAIDGNNIAYVTGQTISSNFPTANPTQLATGGGFDAFVSEINSGGSALTFSTYLGGSQDEDDGGDYGAIAVNSSGAIIYVTGNTASTDFPTTSPFQAANGGGGSDAFVVKYAQGPTFTITASAPAAIAPGASGMSTVTVTSLNGYSSPVNLSCTVSGGGSPAPACSTTSFSPDSVTPTSTSALTITTTGTSAAAFRPSKVFYATWLPVMGLSLVGMGFSSSRSRRKKVLGFLMVAMVMAALFLMPACGGSNNGGSGGGCPGCTPSGAYTVTITGTGTDANATTASTQITLTVN